MNFDIEPLLYHDPARRGFVSFLVDRQQHSYPLSRLPDILDCLSDDAEVFLSQGEFFRPNRRLANLERLPVLFADCDTYSTSYGSLSPDAQVQALLLHCENVGLPRPSLVNYSGRGLHVKWPLDKPVPAMALPRWNRVQQELTNALKPFGADRGARDGSRCLRHVGSVNPRSGQRVVTIYVDERNGNIVRWNFETLCYEILPMSRNELREKKRQAKRKATGKGLVSNLWTPRMLWWNRLGDLRRLIELRGWQEGVPEGYRNNFLLVATCAVCWGAEPDNLEAEVRALAAEFTPSLRAGEVRACTATAIHKAKEQKAYRCTSLRLVELLDIQPSEERSLLTIITPDERKRRRRERDSRRVRSETNRPTYRANAQKNQIEALALYRQGLSLPDIATRQSRSPFTVEKLLRAESRCREEGRHITP